MKILPTGAPAFRSKKRSSTSTSTTSAGACTFGSVIPYRFGPVIASKSNPVIPVSSGFTRTNSVCVAPISSIIPATISRAASFSCGGTESSKSKISASAPYFGAFRIQSSLFPGTNSTDRSGLASNLITSLQNYQDLLYCLHKFGVWRRGNPCGCPSWNELPVVGRMCIR